MNKFLNIPEGDIVYKSKYFFAIRDRFPVSKGHTLIISKEQKADYFDLSMEEKQELPLVIDEIQKRLVKEFEPDGYNIGMNCGEAAGQTIFHFHCHIIPRYKGDMEDPRGGVRHSIKGKGYY